MLHTALKHETYMYIVHYTTLKHVRAGSGRGGGIGVGGGSVIGGGGGVGSKMVKYPVARGQA